MTIDLICPPPPTRTLSARTPELPHDASDWRLWLDYGLAWADGAWSDGAWCDGAWYDGAWYSGTGSEPGALTPSSVPGEDGGPATDAGATARRTLTMHAYREPVPGPRWEALYDATWPAYRAWYLREGADRRAPLAESRRELARHMPQLVPTWQRLVELTGGDDTAAALLTMWRLPVFAAGCAQVALPGPDPLLVRNYDYDPALFEGVVASTNYSGRRRVIGTSDLLWGLVDGTNEDGLAVSLTYGGRPGGGPGFAIPLVLRYVLETCTTVTQAVAVLRRLPIAQAYNIAIVDRSGAHATVFVAPEEELVVSDLRASTNHRLDEVEFPRIADRLGSMERQRVLLTQLDRTGGTDARQTRRRELVEAFTRAPLRSDRYAAGFGTLYTAVYRPLTGEVTYLWPGASWTRGFDDEDEVFTVSVSDG